MCGDVLSYATAESGGDSADRACAAVPTAPRAGSRAVKRDGTSRNRTADAGNTAREQTTRNSPDGHMEIVPKHRLGADPRTGPGKLPRHRPAPPPVARGPAGDTGNSAGGGTRDRPPFAAKSGWHANAASGLPPADMPDHNIATGHTGDRRTARIPLIDSGDAAAPGKSLALKKIGDHDEVDPRESQLPKGQVPGRTSTPLRDALYPLPYPSASLRSRLITRLPGRHFSAASRHNPSPARPSLDRRSGRMTGRR